MDLWSDRMYRGSTRRLYRGCRNETRRYHFTSVTQDYHTARGSQGIPRWQEAIFAAMAGILFLSQMSSNYLTTRW